MAIEAIAIDVFSLIETKEALARSAAARSLLPERLARFRHGVDTCQPQIPQITLAECQQLETRTRSSAPFASSFDKSLAQCGNRLCNLKSIHR
jgi:hypothetical protein